MIIKIAEYTVKKGMVDNVVKAIEVFVRAVNKYEPDTFYEAFRRGDSLDFVHIMKFTDEASEKNHASASYTEVFVKVLYPNCEKEPAFTDLISII